MKIFLIVLFYCSIAFAQDDGLICAERGHVFDGIYSSTLMYCPPRLLDLPDKTIEIYWDQNIVTKVCKRCGAVIKELAQEKPDTLIVWKRND